MPGFPSDNAKYNAVLTADRRASDRFVFSYKDSYTFCRPTCQSHPLITDRSDVSFFPSAEAAKAAGLKPCGVCNPDDSVNMHSSIQLADDPLSSNMQLDNSKQQPHLLQTVTPNAIPPHMQSQQLQAHQQIPFQQAPPVHIQPQMQNVHVSQPITQHPQPQQVHYLSQNNSPFVSPDSPINPNDNFNARHNRSSSLATSPDFMNPEANGWRPRRASIANGHIAVVAAAVEEISMSNGLDAMGGMASMAGMASMPSMPGMVTKPLPSRREERQRGEGDHARLVNEACMHIAAAAAAAAAQAVSSNEEETRKGRFSSPSRNSSVDRTKQMFKTQRKKRRGGILGFKELAAKAGLSPWHFHRVFRSVTGLTPKAYGDACWNTVTSSMPPIMDNSNHGTGSLLTSTQNYSAQNRSLSSSAVNELYHDSPIPFPRPTPSATLDHDQNKPKGSDMIPSLFNLPASRSSSNSILNSPMVYPTDFAVSNGKDTPTSIVSGYSKIPQQQQQLPQQQQVYQPQLASQQFIAPRDPGVSMHFSMSSEPSSSSANTPPLQQQLQIHTIYPSSSLDSMSSTHSSIVMDANDPLSHPTGQPQVLDGNNWSVPMPFMDSTMAPPVSDFGLFPLGDTWLEEQSQPLCMPAVGVLMTEGIELEPSLSMMHIGTPSFQLGMPEVSHESLGHDGATITNNMMVLPSDVSHHSSGDSYQAKTSLDKVKSGLGEPVLGHQIGGDIGSTGNASSTGTSSHEDRGHSTSTAGVPTHTEPWMASSQQPLDPTDNVAPLFT